MEDCPRCEFPLQAMGLRECPKCGYAGALRAGKGTQQGVLEVDIAHSGESWEMAKKKLDQALDDALYYNHAGLKVIHGWGSSSGGEAVIGPRAQSYLRHYAEVYGGRFTTDRHTPGASLIWFNS